jgi:hypothetical protein
MTLRVNEQRRLPGRLQAKALSSDDASGVRDLAADCHSITPVPLIWC